MTLNTLIFGPKASVKDVQDAPTYDDPLRRRDFPAALPLLRAAISRDDPRAMGAYGALCAMGHGVRKDWQDAYCWFLQGATRGDVPSQLALGMCCIGGLGTAVNNPAAAYWLYRAGTAGNLRAIRVLSALAAKDPSVVGLHFTEDQLDQLRHPSGDVGVATFADTSALGRT